MDDGRSGALWLRGRGHDAVHLLEAGLADPPDSAVLAKAHAEGRVLLTCDLDFGELLADLGGPRASVVLFRVTSRRLDCILPRLSRVLDECAAALAAGAPSWSPTRPASGSGGCRFDRERPQRWAATGYGDDAVSDLKVDWLDRARTFQRDIWTGLAGYSGAKASGLHGGPTLG